MTTQGAVVVLENNGIARCKSRVQVRVDLVNLVEQRSSTAPTSLRKTVSSENRPFSVSGIRPLLSATAAANPGRNTSNVRQSGTG